MSYPYFSYRRPAKLTDYGLKRIPDYTELAYKEAVSKLRYFLSGNYVPSVRSYGGSASIKNLDESDGDLDKKYVSPTSYNTLLDYKPRPRLTAKYATLYADSLNNSYTPQHNVNVAPPPTAPVGSSDPTGGTNPDVINFIQKQEEYIEQLERESQYCRDELNNLLGKVKEVISENEHLHEAQKNKLISRMFQYGSETDELDDVGDSTGLDSDNKATPSKTRKSRSRSTRLEGPNIVFESRISELEAQLTQARIDLKKVQEENNENKRKLASGLVDSTCLDGFKRQIDNLQRDKSSLEAQISKLKLSLESRDGEYRRGSDAVEHQLRDERNNLETEIRRLKDDLAKERSKVRELAGEGARRAVQERSAAEQRYNQHFDELQHDLAAQYDNVAKLQLEMERQRREENDLKRELSMKNAAIEELKMELKNKSATLQADLAQAYAEKASLEEELANARLAIERHQRQSKHETNRLNSEIQSLRQRLDRADADLVHSRRENLRLSDQISTLEKEMNMKSLTPYSPEKKKEKELSTMLESMENKHAKTVAELESMIHSQNSLMEKLTGECRLLTDKLDDANRRHKEELGTLQRQVEGLSHSLQGTRDQAPSTYQAPATHASATSRDIPQSTGTRQDDSRTEPTRDPNTGHAALPQLGQDRAGPGPIVKQESRQAIIDPQIVEEDTEKDPIQAISEPNQPIEESSYDQTENHFEQDNPNQLVEGVDKVQYETPVEGEVPVQSEDYNQVYQQGHTENPEYQNQGQFEQGETESQQYNTGYDQQYEQQQFAEGQYENYEQYPQDYVDPNAQYEGQYENYATDSNYQGENYDNSQFNQEYTGEYEQTAEATNADSKRSNTPNNKVPSQS